MPCLPKNCAALSVIALKKMISARLQQVCRTLTWCHLKRCFYFFFLKYAVLGFVFLRAFLLFFLLTQTFLSGLLLRKPILVSLREKCAHSPLLDRKKKRFSPFLFLNYTVLSVSAAEKGVLPVCRRSRSF